MCRALIIPQTQNPQIQNPKTPNRKTPNPKTPNPKTPNPKTRNCTQIPSLGIRQDVINFANCTMESEKFVTVREQTGEQVARLSIISATIWPLLERTDDDKVVNGSS